MKLETMSTPHVLLDDGHYQGPLCLHVAPYKGRTLVRLSRCYRDREGNINPGGIGVSFNADDFGTLFTALNAWVNSQRKPAGKAKNIPAQRAMVA